jgi:fructokinase
MGGGVMHVASLFPLIRTRLQELLADYVQNPSIIDDIDEFVVPPALGDQAGMLGGVALAQQALDA